MAENAGATDTVERISSVANWPHDVLAMTQLRYWQHVLNEMLKRRLFSVPIHLAFGYEAVAVALDRCMRPDDVLCLSHRNVAYNLARSKSLDAVLRHYRLERSAPCGGKMGSMNLASENTSIAYTSSILGNNLPVATGIALNRKLRQRKDVVFVFSGDGAMEEGAFWESLIFARSHGLGLIFVVENNDQSMSSTIAQRRTAVDLGKICAGVDVQFERVSGAGYQDVLATFRACMLRAESGAPACVEVKLTAFNQHSGPTPGWPEDQMHVSLEDGLLLKDDPSDPLYHVRQKMGSADFEEMAATVMKADNIEKYLS